MKFILYLFLLIFSIHARAAKNGILIDCQIKDSQWQGSITLDSIGQGLLSFENLVGKKKYACKLSLDFFANRPEGEVPGIFADFSRADCTPNLAEGIEKEILQRISLNIERWDGDRPKATLQWLKSSQPEACELAKLNYSDIALNSKKWSRSTSSER